MVLNELSNRILVRLAQSLNISFKIVTSCVSKDAKSSEVRLLHSKDILIIDVAFDMLCDAIFVFFSIYGNLKT